MPKVLTQSKNVPQVEFNKQLDRTSKWNCQMGETSYHHKLQDRIKPTTKGILQFKASRVDRVLFKEVPDYDSKGENAMQQEQFAMSLLKKKQRNKGKAKKALRDDEEEDGGRGVVSAQENELDAVTNLRERMYELEAKAHKQKNLRDELTNGYKKTTSFSIDKQNNREQETFY